MQTNQISSDRSLAVLDKLSRRGQFQFCIALWLYGTNPDIIIKLSGKDIVVLQTNFFLAEGKYQVSYTSSYLPLDQDHTSEYQASGDE